MTWINLHLQSAEKMYNKLAPWQLFLKLYQLYPLFFYLDIKNGHFIESTNYLFQLV